MGILWNFILSFLRTANLGLFTADSNYLTNEIEAFNCAVLHSPLRRNQKRLDKLWTLQTANNVIYDKVYITTSIQLFNFPLTKQYFHEKSGPLQVSTA